MLTVKAANSPLSGRLHPSHMSALNSSSFPVYIITCTDADISSPVPSHTAVYSGVDSPDVTLYSFIHAVDVVESLNSVAMRGSSVPSRLLTVKLTMPSEISVTVMCFSASNEGSDASDVETIDVVLAGGYM
jgi:hypothetical protein